MAVLSAVGLTGWVVLCLALGGLEPSGYPLAQDFAPYWTAAKLAARGLVAVAYDPASHFAEERRLFGGAPFAEATPFFYPPVFLLIVLPFAALAYLPALLAWTGLTVGAYWASVRAIWPGAGLAVPVLAFPAVFINIVNGQNGLISAALFAAAALLLDRRPVLAGVCYGCLAYKPQLAVIVPVALLAWRMRAAFVAAAVTAVTLAAASFAVFGLQAWRSFFAASTIARQALESGAAVPGRMASVFAAAQLWGAGLPLAYALQAIAALLAASGLLTLGGRTPPFARGAVIAAAVPLISPYMFDYDLAVIAVPMAWVMREGRSDRFLPWEKAVLCAAFVLPLIARAVALKLSLPLAPLVTAALYVVVLHRARCSGMLQIE